MEIELIQQEGIDPPPKGHTAVLHREIHPLGIMAAVTPIEIVVPLTEAMAVLTETVVLLTEVVAEVIHVDKGKL